MAKIINTTSNKTQAKSASGSGSTYPGSMKAVRSQGTAAARSYGSTKTIYSKSNEEKRTQTSSTGRYTPSARNNNSDSRRERTHKESAPVSSVKSMYNSSWSTRTEDEKKDYTGDYVRRRRAYEDSADEGRRRDSEDRVNMGQFAYGLVDQAANQFVGDILGTADMFFGTPIQKALDFSEEKFGLPDSGENFLYAYNRQFQKNAQAEAEYYAKNAEKNELARLVNAYGPDVLAFLPEAALAYFSKGASLAAKGTKVAAKTAKAANKISKLDNVADAMKNGALWGGTARTAGQSYNQALAEGADTKEAVKYALANSAVDFGLNSIGLMRGQAGMENLPGQLRNLDTPMQYLRAYGKATAHDGLEGIAQGAVRRGARAIYDDNVELISADNPVAVMNPKAAAMDFAGGAAASLAVSGMHAGTKALDIPANAAAARLERAYFKEKIKGNSKGLSDAYLERQVELLDKLLTGHVLEANEIRDLDMKNKEIQRIFTRKTGVPISKFDTDREDVLRQKYQFGALKVNNGDAVKPKYPIAKLGDAAYTGVTKKPVKQSYVHGNWDGVEFLDEKDIFVGNKLKANTSYTGGENEYNYQTDSAGRIQHATGVLVPKQHEGREKIKDNKTPGKLKGDHASHIIADLFGGSSGLGNLISLKARVNQSDHRKIEIIHQKALEGQGKVYVDYDIHYSGDDVRPDKLTATFYYGKDFDSMQFETIDIYND